MENHYCDEHKALKIEIEQLKNTMLRIEVKIDKLIWLFVASGIASGTLAGSLL